MRRLLILVVLLLGSVTAQTPDIDPPETGDAGGFAVTLTCQAAAPRVAVLCSVERSVWAVAGFAVTLGVEARAAFSQPVDGHVAGYVTLSYQWDRGFAWVDLRTPEVAPAIGTSDTLRFGISVQIGGTP